MPFDQTAACEAYKARKVAAGICATCTRPQAPTSRRLCQEHLDRKTARVKAHREEKIAAGICAMCSNPIVDNGKRYCQEHRKLNADRLEEWRIVNVKMTVKNVVSGKFNMWCAARGFNRMWGDTAAQAQERFVKKFG